MQIMRANMTHVLRKTSCNGMKQLFLPTEVYFSCEHFKKGSSICVSLRFQLLSNYPMIQLLMQLTSTSNFLQRAPLFSYTTAVPKHILQSSNIAAVPVAYSSFLPPPMKEPRRHSNITVRTGRNI